MIYFTVPKWVKQHDIDFTNLGNRQYLVKKIKRDLERYKVSNPKVSIVIPAYNEEKTLLRTLSSFSKMTSRYHAELIVVNNNSTDRTQKIIDACGVKSVFETQQGISYARQAGLEAARGTYILNADSDSIYPPKWIDAMTEALEYENIVCVYGRYSFLPSEGVSRIGLAFHETAASFLIHLKRINREFVNVMGFNFGFRKKDGLEVGGFEHQLDRANTERSEDGWMAYLLHHLGKIKLVSHKNARVWTSDRRLIEAGSLSKAFWIRFKKHFSRLWNYIKPFEHGF